LFWGKKKSGFARTLAKKDIKNTFGWAGKKVWEMVTPIKRNMCRHKKKTQKKERPPKKKSKKGGGKSPWVGAELVKSKEFRESVVRR